MWQLAAAKAYLVLLLLLLHGAAALVFIAIWSEQHHLGECHHQQGGWPCEHHSEDQGWQD
jgi:hypothetical protein